MVQSQKDAGDSGDDEEKGTNVMKKSDDVIEGDPGNDDVMKKALKRRGDVGEQGGGGKKRKVNDTRKTEQKKQGRQTGKNPLLLIQESPVSRRSAYMTRSRGDVPGINPQTSSSQQRSATPYKRSAAAKKSKGQSSTGDDSTDSETPGRKCHKCTICPFWCYDRQRLNEHKECHVQIVAEVNQRDDSEQSKTDNDNSAQSEGNMSDDSDSCPELSAPPPRKPHRKKASTKTSRSHNNRTRARQKTLCSLTGCNKHPKGVTCIRGPVVLIEPIGKPPPPVRVHAVSKSCKACKMLCTEWGRESRTAEPGTAQVLESSESNSETNKVEKREESKHQENSSSGMEASGVEVQCASRTDEPGTAQQGPSDGTAHLVEESRGQVYTHHGPSHSTAQTLEGSGVEVQGAAENHGSSDMVQKLSRKRHDSSSTTEIGRNTTLANKSRQSVAEQAGSSRKSHIESSGAGSEDNSQEEETHQGRRRVITVHAVSFSDTEDTVQGLVDSAQQGRTQDSDIEWSDIEGEVFHTALKSPAKKNIITVYPVEFSDSDVFHSLDDGPSHLAQNSPGPSDVELSEDDGAGELRLCLSTTDNEYSDHDHSIPEALENVHSSQDHHGRRNTVPSSPGASGDEHSNLGVSASFTVSHGSRSAVHHDESNCTGSYVIASSSDESVVLDSGENGKNNTQNNDQSNHAGSVGQESRSSRSYVIASFSSDDSVVLMDDLDSSVEYSKNSTQHEPQDEPWNEQQWEEFVKNLKDSKQKKKGKTVKKMALTWKTADSLTDAHPDDAHRDDITNHRSADQMEHNEEKPEEARRRKRKGKTDKKTEPRESTRKTADKQMDAHRDDTTNHRSADQMERNEVKPEEARRRKRKGKTDKKTEPRESTQKTADKQMDAHRDDTTNHRSADQMERNEVKPESRKRKRKGKTDKKTESEASTLKTAAKRHDDTNRRIVEQKHSKNNMGKPKRAKKKREERTDLTRTCAGQDDTDVQVSTDVVAIEKESKQNPKGSGKRKRRNTSAQADVHAPRGEFTSRHEPTDLATASKNTKLAGKATSSKNTKPTGKATSSKNTKPLGKVTSSKNTKPLGKATSSKHTKPTGKATSSKNTEPTGKATSSKNTKPLGKATSSANIKPTDPITTRRNNKPTGKATSSKNTKKPAPG